MIRNHLRYLAPVGLGLLIPIAIFASPPFTGPTTQPTGGNVDGVIWNKVGGGKQTGASINIDGSATASSMTLSQTPTVNFYDNLKLESGKGFRIDSTGASSFSMSNQGAGQQPFTFNIYGDLKMNSFAPGGPGRKGQIDAEWYCIGGTDCINTWPSGGGGSLTGITAGTGISVTGGAPSPTVNLDLTYTDSRYVNSSQVGGDWLTGGLYSYGGFYADTAFKYTDFYGNMQSAGWQNPLNHAFLEINKSNNSINLDLLTTQGIGISHSVDAAYYPNTSGARFQQRNSTTGRENQISFEALSTNRASAAFANQYPDDHPTAHVGGYLGNYSGADYRGIDIVANNPGGAPAIAGYFTHTAGQSARLASATYALDTTGAVNFSGTGNVIVAAGKVFSVGTVTPDASSQATIFGNGINSIALTATGTNWGVKAEGLARGLVAKSANGAAIEAVGSTGIIATGKSTSNVPAYTNYSGAFKHAGNNRYVWLGTPNEAIHSQGNIVLDGFTDATQYGNIVLPVNGTIDFNGTVDQNAMLQFWNDNNFYWNMGTGGQIRIRDYLGTATPFRFTSNGELHSYGNSSGFYFTQRNSPATREWAWFSDAGYAYLGNNAGWTNRVVVSDAGYLGLGKTPAYQLELSLNSAAKPGSNTWTIASDARLKDVKGNYTKGLDEILKLNPVTYSYKKDNAYSYRSDETYVGAIAQEVQKSFPEAVTKDSKGYLQLDTNSINWASINAIKELKAENDKLKSQNETLEWRLRSLEAKVESLLNK